MSVSAKKLKEKKLQKMKKIEEAKKGETLPFKLELNRQIPYYEVNKNFLDESQYGAVSHVCTLSGYNDSSLADGKELLHRFSISVLDLKNNEIVYLKSVMVPNFNEIKLLTDNAFNYLKKAGIEKTTFISRMDRPSPLIKCDCGCKGFKNNMLHRVDFIRYQKELKEKESV